MSIRRKFRLLVERATNTHILRELPRGVDLFFDIRSYLRSFTVENIFDVGANIGQSAHRFVRQFPSARIVCFEPVGEIFQQLQRAVAPYRNVRCENFALAQRSGQATISVNAVLSSLADDPDQLNKDARRETVLVRTLDEYCADSGVAGISLLKTDTEGADLDVLKGSTRLLAEQRIGLIQLEAGMNSRNTRHVPLEDLRRHLESFSYFLFGIYEQIGEWPTREPHLRRTNPVFISEKVIRANTNLPAAAGPFRRQ